MIQRIIPSSGELFPAIGLGTWQTFDIPARQHAQQTVLTEVLQAMHDAGGRLIDSSPMYGYAETTVGELTHSMAARDDFFYATKVWTTGKEAGIRQMNESMEKMGRKTMDLIQIHNLVDWETHFATLQDWKAAGKVRYIGITHYTDDNHSALERIISNQQIDFVQFNYSLLNRHAEKRLLRVAAAYGVAALINRPFGEGRFLARVAGKPIPEWAAEWDIESWSQFLLKYIISHPAVTCVIPATANPTHAADNMLAGQGLLPDEKTRQRMVAAVEGF